MPLIASIVVLATACHHAPRKSAAPTPDVQLAASPVPRSEAPVPSADPLAVYRHAGFLVGAGDLPFIGSVDFLAGPTSDSTLALIAFSLSNRALTFTREGERYRAAYEVVLEVRRDTGLLQRLVTHEEVRVASYKETGRDEESVIYQQFVPLPAGPVALTILARDAGSTRSGTVQATLTVPRFDSTMLARPVAVFRARGRNARGSQPDLVIRPRATAVFGRDSLAEFYVETYAAAEQRQPSAVEALITGEGGFTVFADTVPIIGARQSVRSAVVKVPVARLGFGALTLGITELDSSRQASAPRVSTPLLVTFGEGLTVAPFEEMLQYLRYFTTPQRLRSLRDTTPEGRFRAWDEFLRETDPITATSENEALREYFDRLSDANTRFREDDTSGWLTDRGMVFSTLGEPDNFVVDSNAAPPLGSRVLVWEYSRYRARFVFVDQTGRGRWRLTPSSEADYDAVMRRLAR